MNPDNNIPVHYQPTFASNMEMLLSNEGSILRGTMDEQAVDGEGRSIVDQFGTTRGRKDTERYGDSPQMEVERARRWLYADTFDWGTLIDRKDKLKQVLDPTSALMKSATDGLGENLDYDVILPAFFGTAYVGKQGTETEAFDSANLTVPVGLKSDGTVSGTQGMNVKKLQAARKILRSKKVRLEREEVYVALTAQQEDELFDDAKAIHGDYINGRPLEKGMLPRLFQMNFVYLEDLLLDDDGYRRVPVWVKSGMCLGMQEELMTNIAPRPDKKFMPYVYAAFTAGATRKEQGKVVEIKSYEA